MKNFIILLVSSFFIFFTSTGCVKTIKIPTQSVIKTRLIIEQVNYNNLLISATQPNIIVIEHDFLQNSLCNQVIFNEVAIEYMDRVSDEYIFDYCEWYSGLYPKELCIFYLFPRLPGIAGLTSPKGCILLFSSRSIPTLLHEYGHVLNLRHTEIKNWTSYYESFEDFINYNDINVMNEFVGEQNIFLTEIQRGQYTNRSKFFEFLQAD